MGLSDESDEAIEQKYEELCLDLNMDRTAKQNAWEAFQRIRVNYTLEVGLNAQPCLFWNGLLSFYMRDEMDPKFNNMQQASIIQLMQNVKW